MTFEEVIETIGKVVDASGVAVTLIGAAIATSAFLVRAYRRQAFNESYRRYRQGIGRAILLGLELLVAGDIIRTVAISPTFESVGVLALIVLVRTFLSFALAVELDGRLPWRPRRDGSEQG